MSAEHLDVLIVGAGLSGIGAAHHLQERCPGKSYAILEAREDIGGTWDLFRYPGIRSDSDMHTLGYRFRPWTDAKSIADGASILALRPRHRARGRDRRARSASTTASSRADVVERRGALDGRRPSARDTRRDGDAHLRLPLHVQRLLPLRPGLHARVRRDRALRRRGRPPPALARGPRLRRQAGGRDRQRRDRGDAGPGDGRGRRARDDAAALADLRRLGAGRRRDRQRPAPRPARPRRLPDRALEERHACRASATGSAAAGRS